MLNKKGQIGDTLTWMIATIIIVVVLIFFIFGASMFGKTKSLDGNFKTSIFSNEMHERNDFFIQKTIFTYLLSDEEISRKKMLGEIKAGSAGDGFVSGNESLKNIRRNYDLK